MVRAVDIQAASFRGVPFLVPSDSIKQGPNTVVHGRPGGSQFNEWNGTFTGEFTLRLKLEGKGLLGKYNRLRNALNAPGEGLLVHPWGDNKLCNVIGPWTVSRDDRKMGILELDVTFKEQTSGSILQQISIPVMVTALASQAITGLFSSSHLPTVSTGQFSLKGLSALSGTALNSAVGTVGQSFLSAFAGSPQVTRLATSLKDASVFSSDAEETGALLNSLYREVFESDYSNEIIFDKFKKIDTNLSDALRPVAGLEDYTFDLKQRKKLVSQILGLNKMAVAVSLAEAVAAKVFETAEAVQRDRVYLMTLRYDLSSFTAFQALEQETQALVTDTLLTAQDILSEQELQLPRITQIQAHNMPASVLAYMLYEDPARAPMLANLNPDTEPLLFDGQVNILGDIQ